MRECEDAHSILPLRKAAAVTNSGLSQDMPRSPDGQGKNKLFLLWSSWSWFWLDLDSWALVVIIWQETTPVLHF